MSKALTTGAPEMPRPGLLLLEKNMLPGLVSLSDYTLNQRAALTGPAPEERTERDADHDGGDEHRPESASWRGRRTWNLCLPG